MGSIRKPKKPGGGSIPSPAKPANLHLTLSFKYFTEREPFCLRKDDEAYITALFERLKNICSMDMTSFRTNRSHALRSHPINWQETTEPEGFTHLNPAMREQILGWQFSLSQAEYGRVHGFIVEDVFYVVWFDPEHKLYA